MSCFYKVVLLILFMVIWSLEKDLGELSSKLFWKLNDNSIVHVLLFRLLYRLKTKDSIKTSRAKFLRLSKCIPGNRGKSENTLLICSSQIGTFQIGAVIKIYQNPSNIPFCWLDNRDPHNW